MTTEIKTVLIAGASGTLGQPVVPELLKANLKISVLTRQDSQAAFPDGVTVIRTDYSPASLAAAVKGQDAVLSFLNVAGAGGAAAQTRLIDAAAADGGVKRFVPSDFGHDTADADALHILPLLRSKLGFVHRLADRGLDYSVVITGLFFDSGFSRGFLGQNFKEQTTQVWDEGDVPFAVSKLADIGKALAELLTKPEAYAASRNQYVYLASHIVTQSQVQAAVDSATGKKWPVQRLDGQKTLQENKEKLANGDFSGALKLIQALAFMKINGKALSDYRLRGIWNDRLGLPKTSLEDDVRQALAGIAQ